MSASPPPDGPLPGGDLPAQSGPPSPTPGGQAASELERYGPLLLERTRKDDGRALLYFSAPASE